MKPLILRPGATQTYFASANTRHGFANFYGSVLKEVPRVWCIKGGPGTGKSHLMRKIAAEAARRGMTTILYACSSDPASLDGVLLPELGLALVDGTAPHSADPRYPGAGDEMVDVGVFWNGESLAARRAEIVALGAQKSRAYRVAYQCLAAEGALSAAVKEAAEPAVLQEKLAASAERIVRRMGAGEGFVRDDILLSAIGMHGRSTLSTLTDAAEHILTLRDRFSVGKRLLSALVAAAENARQPVVCAIDPLDTTDLRAVYFPTVRVLYTLDDCDAPCVRELSVARFFAPGVLQRLRGELRTLEHARIAARDAADTALADVRAAHFALEDIYVAAMDFAKKEAFDCALCTRIFAHVGA